MDNDNSNEYGTVPKWLKFRISCHAAVSLVTGVTLQVAIICQSGHRSITIRTDNWHSGESICAFLSPLLNHLSETHVASTLSLPPFLYMVPVSYIWGYQRSSKSHQYFTPNWLPWRYNISVSIGNGEVPSGFTVKPMERGDFVWDSARWEFVHRFINYKPLYYHQSTTSLIFIFYEGGRHRCSFP